MATRKPRARRCDHCGQLGAVHPWTFHACADKRRKRKAILCTSCDIMANAWLLHFFQVPGATTKLGTYRP